jgi:hypothetical protein
VELTPRWDYDFQKAALLNCEAVGNLPAMPDPPTFDFCSGIKEPNRAPEPPAPTDAPPETLDDLKDTPQEDIQQVTDEVISETLEAQSASTIFGLGACAVIAGLS